jgi:aerobic-type carbon monoxide dehydrogenase small subunit (CoxS/CutS family)
MSAGSAVQGIANFKSETVVVNGIRLHYWIGGNLCRCGAYNGIVDAITEFAGTTR